MSNFELNKKIVELYKNSENKNILVKNIRYDSFTGEYNKNIILVFIMIIGLLFFYVKIQVNIDLKNWDFKKCNPKYLFFSGYIYNDTNLSNSDATLYNFTKCTNSFVKEKYDFIVNSEFEKDTNKIKNKMSKFSNNNKKTQQKRKNELKQMQEDISGQFSALQDKVSFNLDLSGTYAYTTIKNSGIYVDQINGLMKYIGDYIKQYLTYQMVEHANKCINKGTDAEGNAICNEGDENYAKAVKINNILQRFGGNNL